MKILSFHHGYSRFVIGIGPIVIKFASLRNGHRAFIIGAHGNLHEREIYYTAGICSDKNKHLIAPTYWCCWFGLFCIAKRYAPAKVHVKTITTDMEEINKSGIQNVDFSISNFGVTKENKLIILDYGNCGFFL